MTTDNYVERNKKLILKLFLYKLAKTPNTSISHNIDHSAVEIEYKTDLSKFHVRIYENKLLVFSNSKYDPMKEFPDYSQKLVDYVESIIQDSIDRF